MINEVGSIDNRIIFEFKPNTVFKDYNLISGYVDQCNDYIINSFPEIRMTRWKLRILYLVFFTLLHNAYMLRKLTFKQKNENKMESYLRWKMEVCEVLGGRIDYDNHHELQRF